MSMGAIGNLVTVLTLIGGKSPETEWWCGVTTGGSVLNVDIKVSN